MGKWHEDGVIDVVWGGYASRQWSNTMGTPLTPLTFLKVMC